MLETHSIADEAIIGCRPNGEAYTYRMLKNDIAESEQEFEAGCGTTQQDLRNQIKGWGKPPRKFAFK